MLNRLSSADFFSILLASRLSALDGAYTIQLPPSLGDGKAFRLSFSVARHEKLTLMSDTALIGPGGKPEYLPAPGSGIGNDVITADTRNTGCIVLAKASADPDVMFKLRVLKEKRVSIFTRSLQCFSLSTIHRVGERLDGNPIPPLQRDPPRMGVASLVVDADDVTRRSHSGIFSSTAPGAFGRSRV